MADEVRHVAFGALALTGYYNELTSAEPLERQDFVLEASWLMRDRLLATEVWERLGIPPSDGLIDTSRSRMTQMFQHVLFAKITPNLTKDGLMDEKLRDRLAGGDRRHRDLVTRHRRARSVEAGAQQWCP